MTSATRSSARWDCSRGRLPNPESISPIAPCSTTPIDCAAARVTFFQSLASALASCDLNQKKRHIDLTRGESVQGQGGIGVRLFDRIDAGLAGYALWQVRDDRGADLPAPLRGLRDRVFGIGPEVSP
jgi:hypothetical protein